MTDQQSGVASSTANNATDTQKQTLSIPNEMAPLDKCIFKDLSKSFNQITITGYDSVTGLDVQGHAFDKVLQKCDTPPTCIKFIDTKQITGDILPGELVQLPQIEAIDISECGVREIPQVLLQMKQLRVLKASDNHISSLPEYWQQLNLTALDISKNIICKVDSSIQNLGNLQILAMADCNLKDFPYHVLELKFLKALIIDNNPISVIELTKHRLYNLQTLSLRSCRLTEVPPWLTANLHHFDIRNNSIQTFPSCLSENISVLKLGGNQLDIIPDEISLLQNVEVLDVSSCGLKEFPNAVLTLTKLQSLNVEDNYIHTIPHDITRLDLKELYIGENSFDEFSNFLDEFVNLNVIDVSSCLLETFPFDFRKLTNLREITVNDNYIKEIPEEISQIKLQKLLMKGNPVKQLPETFQNLQALEELDLSSSGLKIIPRQILALINLEDLSMRNNAMETLPPDWDKCVNLKNFDLSENLLHQLPSSISQLQKLEVLTLEYCCFTEFPDVLLEVSSLKSLNLAQNQLSTLPHEFGQLHLTRLVLRDNLIQLLPASFHYQIRLQYLDLSSCPLKEFPSEILKLKNLKHLCLSDNNISVLPTNWANLQISTLSLHNNPLHETPNESLHQLKSLVSLSLGNCLLTEIPSWFSTFERMTLLNISGNNITSSGISALPPSLTDLYARGNPLEIMPEAIKHCVNLTNLSLKNCDLTELPTFMGNLRKLKVLDIGSNGLKYLPNVLKDMALHTLNVEWNPIETLEALEELKTLRELQASGCRLESFPKVIMSMPKLTKVRLDDNTIGSFPDDLVHHCLTEMSISRNPIKTLPPSITELKHLHALSVDSTQLKEFPQVLLDMKSLKKLDIRLYAHGTRSASLQLPIVWKNLQTLRQFSSTYTFHLTSLQSLRNLVKLEICSSKELIPIDAVGSKFVKELDLSVYFHHRQYDKFPEIEKLSSLISLGIRGYKRSHSPDSLTELTELETLLISSCNLKRFPEILSRRLLKLRSLSIDGNPFMFLPEVWYCKRLLKINLRDTPVDSSHSISQLRCLTDVNLSDCRLRTFPSAVLQLQKLRELNIENNNITALPPDWNNVDLTYLNMQDNSLADGLPLDSLNQLSKLDSLNISGNFS